MFEQVSIIMAYKQDHGPRDLAFKWINKFYKSAMPNVELCIGVSNGDAFNRSQGMNTAAQKATRDIFVIADGDIIFNPIVIIDAIKLLKDNAWVIPFHHHKIINLSPQNTEKVLKSKPKWPLRVEVRDFTIEKRDMNFAGKLNVITRSNFTRVGGFDKRFVGYGWEDNAFQDAVSTICGPHKRLDRELFHLWHSPVKSKGNPYWEKNKELGMLYRSARGNKNAMEKLIEGRG